jgi:hypothetical protein
MVGGGFGASSAGGDDAIRNSESRTVSEKRYDRYVGCIKAIWMMFEM